MTGEDAVGVIVDILCRCGIDYMLVGSFSSNYYGIARATRDADFVIHADSTALRTLEAELPDGFVFDPQQSFEMVTSTTKCRVVIDEIPFEIEFFNLSQDEFDQQRFHRRRAVKDGERNCFLPTPEDVIVQKLRWAKGGKRGKDYDDARDVMAVQGNALDFDYIRTWADRHGTREMCEEIYESVKSLF